MLEEQLETYRCYNLVTRSMARNLSKLYERHLAPSGVTATDLAIFDFLHRAGKLNQNDLAIRMSMERTTLVRTIKPLKAAGYIDTSSDPKLTRRYLLSLTPSGKDKMVEAHNLWVHAQAEWEAAHGTEKSQELRAEMFSTLGIDQSAA